MRQASVMIVASEVVIRHTYASQCDVSSGNRTRGAWWTVGAVERWCRTWDFWGNGVLLFCYRSVFS